MIRDFHFADWFTLANAVCGTGAVFTSMTYLQSGEVSRLMLLALTADEVALWVVALGSRELPVGHRDVERHQVLALQEVVQVRR